LKAVPAIEESRGRKEVERERKREKQNNTRMKQKNERKNKKKGRRNTSMTKQEQEKIQKKIKRRKKTIEKIKMGFQIFSLLFSLLLFSSLLFLSVLFLCFSSLSLSSLLFSLLSVCSSLSLLLFLFLLLFVFTCISPKRIIDQAMQISLSFESNLRGGVQSEIAVGASLSGDGEDVDRFREVGDGGQGGASEGRGDLQRAFGSVLRATNVVADMEKRE
jgi:hypothetical protein